VATGEFKPDPKKSLYVHLFADGGIYLVRGSGEAFLATQERLLEEIDAVIAGGGVLLYGRDNPKSDPTPIVTEAFKRILDKKPPLQLLVEPHPAVKARPTDLTSLILAASVGNTEVVRDLCERGADIEAFTRERMNPLMLAANGGHSETVRELIRRGANINARGEQESTPLMFAAQNGDDAVVQALLSAGADANVRGSHGLTALGFARQNRHERTARLLQSAGARG
jgi:ankyrin repeat protein